MDTRPATILEDGDYALDDVFLTPQELEGIELARADVDARGGIPWEEVRAWLHSLDTPNPLPEPQPRKF